MTAAPQKGGLRYGVRVEKEQDWVIFLHLEPFPLPWNDMASKNPPIPRIYLMGISRLLCIFVTFQMLRTTLTPTPRSA